MYSSWRWSSIKAGGDDMIMRLIAAFITAACFGFLFKVPKKDILYCGITGFLGWSVLEMTGDVFWATVTIAVVSLYLAKLRRTIATIYLVTGIIPYVPGAGIYNTMYYMVFDMPEEAMVAGLNAFLSAGSIALGVIFAFSLNKVRRQLFIRRR